jgi:hypothetical protein
MSSIEENSDPQGLRRRAAAPQPASGASSSSNRQDDAASGCADQSVIISAAAPSSTPELVVAQEQFNVLSFLKELYAKYNACLAAHPVKTKAITSSVIAMTGEIFGSFVRARRAGTKVSIQPRRVAMFGTFGFCCTGPMLHFWYLACEYILTVKLKFTGRKKTIAKLILDRCLWGPPYSLFTVIFLNFFQSLSAEQTWREVRNKYFAILIMSQKLWVPMQLVNFELVAQQYQVLFVSLVNVGWNTYLSLAN